jgi:hypothetical protein
MKFSKKFISNAKFLILMVVLTICLSLDVMSLDALYNHKIDTTIASLMFSGFCILTFFVIHKILSLIYRGD